jgi:hypothetical protein
VWIRNDCYRRRGYEIRFTTGSPQGRTHGRDDLYKPELWKELLNQAFKKSEKLASDFGSSSSQPIVVVADRDEGATKAAITNA